jgi:hypothetical protein
LVLTTQLNRTGRGEVGEQSCGSEGEGGGGPGEGLISRSPSIDLKFGLVSRSSVECRNRLQ